MNGSFCCLPSKQQDGTRKVVVEKFPASRPSPPDLKDSILLCSRLLLYRFAVKQAGKRR